MAYQESKSIGRTFHDLAVREVVEQRGLRRAIAVLAFVVATSLAAQVAVPLPWTEVPMTLQPMLVILAGAVLGPWLGATAMALYLSVGMLGAPVFAMGGAGVAWLMGPTGGYLIAYPAAAFLVGLIARGDAGWIRTALALTAGMAVIYLGGVSQLMLFTGQGPAEAAAVGVLPFVLADLNKVVLALVLAKKAGDTSLGDL